MVLAAIALLASCGTVLKRAREHVSLYHPTKAPVQTAAKELRVQAVCLVFCTKLIPETPSALNSKAGHSFFLHAATPGALGLDDLNRTWTAERL